MQQCTRSKTNLQTHTYKLEDSKGNTKIVHCNLVLDISFLFFLFSFATDLLDSLEEESKVNRTSAWIINGSEDQLSQGASELSYEEQSADDQAQCSPSDQSHLNRDSDLDSLVAEPGSDSPLKSEVLSGQQDTQSHPAHTHDGDTGDSETQLQVADPVHDANTQVRSKDVGHDSGTQVHLPVNTGHEVRTRAGRVSKRVDQLIESMVQKLFVFRDLASLISRKPQSLLTLL